MFHFCFIFYIQKSEWKKKYQEAQNRHQQKQEEASLSGIALSWQHFGIILSRLWFVYVTAEERECQASGGLVCREKLWLQFEETSAAGCLSLFSVEPEGQTHQISGG